MEKKKKATEHMIVDSVDALIAKMEQVREAQRIFSTYTCLLYTSCGKRSVSPAYCPCDSSGPPKPG